MSRCVTAAALIVQTNLSCAFFHNNNTYGTENKLDIKPQAALLYVFYIGFNPTLEFDIASAFHLCCTGETALDKAIDERNHKAAELLRAAGAR